MSHAIEKQKEISKNILSIYTNVKDVTTKEMSVEEFQKSFPVEEFTVVSNDTMKSYAKEQVGKINAIKDEVEKGQLTSVIAEELKSYDKTIVVGKNDIKKSFYTKKKVKEDKKDDDKKEDSKEDNDKEDKDSK